MKNPFKVRTAVWWKIWGLFALTYFMWQVALASGAEKTMGEKLMDPLYLMGIAIMFLYGLLAVSFGKNIKNWEEQIKGIKESTEKQIKKLEDINVDQWDRINEINASLCNLQGKHDTIVAKGGHK